MSLLLLPYYSISKFKSFPCRPNFIIFLILLLALNRNRYSKHKDRHNVQSFILPWPKKSSQISVFQIFFCWEPNKFALQGSAWCSESGWIKISIHFLFKAGEKWLSQGKWERRIGLILGLISLIIDSISCLKIICASQIYIHITCVGTTWLKIDFELVAFYF